MLRWLDLLGGGDLFNPRGPRETPKHVLPHVLGGGLLTNVCMTFGVCVKRCGFFIRQNGGQKSTHLQKPKLPRLVESVNRLTMLCFLYYVFSASRSLSSLHQTLSPFLFFLGRLLVQRCFKCFTDQVHEIFAEHGSSFLGL